MVLGRRVLWSVVTSVAVIAALAARVELPVAIRVAYDTLIVNGPHPVLLGARALNRGGHSVWPRWLRYASSDTSVAVATSDDAVTCKETGDATIAIRRGSIARNMLVRCRPIVGFWFQGVRLELGGGPKPLEVDPRGPRGKPVTLLQGRSSIADPHVAQMHDQMLYPVSVGQTEVAVEFSGGTHTSVRVTVTERVIEKPLELVAGEFRAFHVEKGRYEILLDGPGANGRDPSLVIAMPRGNCASGWKQGESVQHYFCSAKNDEETIVVRNTLPPGSGQVLVGALHVIRLPSPAATTWLLAEHMQAAARGHAR